MSVGYAKILLSNNERQQMTKVEHSLKFVTEFDETHPTAQRFLELDEASRIAMLEGMLKELIAPALKQTIDELNAGNSYATLKVVA
jgi:hypothetical protein